MGHQTMIVVSTSHPFNGSPAPLPTVKDGDQIDVKLQHKILLD